MTAKTYVLKEMFDTLQGEGGRAGARSIFVRFAGCNLWDGHPAHRDRGKGACAKWCDTDFFKGTKATADEIVAALEALWPETPGPTVRRGRWAVLTGGEPLLQLDAELVDKLHEAGWLLAVETNGSVAIPKDVELDWVCVSPKLGAPELKIEDGEELKVVLPGAAPGLPGWTEEQLQALARDTYFSHYFVQPQDPIDARRVDVTLLKTPQLVDASLKRELKRNVEQCVDFVKRNPRWRLTLQTHKYIELP